MSSLPSPPPSPLLSPRKVPLSDTSASSDDEESIPTRRPLPKEVWSLIAEYVRVPMPARKEITERKQIRQVDLAHMMSVCKLVNHGTAPILYRFVISDDLYSLFWGFNTDNIPSAPGVCSKAELLRLTRTLYLEYPIRPMTDLHDLHLMGEDFHRPGLEPRTGKQIFFGSRNHRPDASLAALVEAEWLFVQTPSTQFHNSMPDLEVLCCGALFGTDESGWASCRDTLVGFEQRVHAVHKVFAQMYLSGNIKHYCQSGIYSAYCLDAAELQSFPPPLQARISHPDFDEYRSLDLHINLHDFLSTDYDDTFAALPCYPNIHVNWSFDQPRADSVPRSLIHKPFLEMETTPPFANAILASLQAALAGRHERQLALSAERAALPLPNFMVEANIPMSKGTVKRILRELRQSDSPFAVVASDAPDIRLGASCAAGHLSSQIHDELFWTDRRHKLISREDEFFLYRSEKFLRGWPCWACSWSPGMRAGNAL